MTKKTLVGPVTLFLNYKFPEIFVKTGKRLFIYIKKNSVHIFLPEKKDIYNLSLSFRSQNFLKSSY